MYFWIQNFLEKNSDYKEEQHDQQNEKKEPSPCDVITKQNNMPEIVCVLYYYCSS